MKPPCAACPTGISGNPCPPKCVRKVRREAANESKFNKRGDEIKMQRTEEEKSSAALRSKEIGDLGEAVARDALRVCGFEMIERIHTPYKILYKKSLQYGKMVSVPWKVIPLEKVSGDFIAIAQGGRKVLAEVKYRDDSLYFGDLKPHQRDALSKNMVYGGISLVVWVMRHKWNVYDWSEAPLRKGGAPILPDEKRGLVISKPY